METQVKIVLFLQCIQFLCSIGVLIQWYMDRRQQTEMEGCIGWGGECQSLFHPVYCVDCVQKAVNDSYNSHEKSCLGWRTECKSGLSPIYCSKCVEKMHTEFYENGGADSTKDKT